MTRANLMLFEDEVRKQFQGEEVIPRPEWSQKIASGKDLSGGGEDSPDSSMPLPEGEELRFSTNWNGKLDCLAFTTFRLFNPRKYHRGARYKIVLKAERRGVAVLEELLTVRYPDITPLVAWVDTGYDLETFRKILKQMHARHVQDFERSLWHLLVLRWEVRS